MLAVLERQNTVIAQTGRTTPDDHVPAEERNALGRIGTLQAAEQENRRQPKRDRHDRRNEVPLVAIDVEGELCPWLVPINQAGVCRETRESATRCRAISEFGEDVRHRRPRVARARIDGIVAVPLTIADPAYCPAGA